MLKEIFLDPQTGREVESVEWDGSAATGIYIYIFLISIPSTIRRWLRCAIAMIRVSAE